MAHLDLLVRFRYSIGMYVYECLFILGIPGEKGGIGEKGQDGEETYGIFVFLSFFLIL